MKCYCKIWFCLVLISLIFTNVGCKKTPPKLLPSISTAPITNLTSSSVVSGGSVLSDGNAVVTARGVCWGENENPTISNNKTSDGSGIGAFTSTISGLSPGKLYFLRAYATNIVGTAYGNQISLTTTSILPTVSTTEVSEISSSSAKSGGNITDDGGSPVTLRGVCWSLNQNPTTKDSVSVNGTGIGIFSSNITSLVPGATYFVRAYATNEKGTTYGNQLTFNAASTFATITTNHITDITNISSNCEGSIIDDGGSSITERGICWNTSPNPTISNSKSSNGARLGNFNLSITGLSEGTKYFVRAYCTNSAGTAYGNEVSFKTLSNEDYLKCEQAYPGVKGEIVSVIVGKDTLILKKVNDDYVYEGDIIFYEEQIATTKGAGSINTIKWPNNIVYFSISSNVNDHQPIENAIKEYENKTNLIFKQRTNEKNFIEFKSHNEDFSDSNLGMVDYLFKHNLIRLGTKNYNAGVVMHEIGHAIGLEHEHSKKGRDQYIEVLWENVEDSETARYNLEEKTNTIVTPGFDFNSIMLYWSGSFSKNGGYTLVKRDNRKPFGNQREYLSPDDIKIINLMYPSKPLLSTIEASEITENSVKSGGIIIKDGGYHITKKGVCWSTSTNPDINDNKTSDGTGNESYTSNVTDLDPGTTYFLRAYAENASGLGVNYGNQITFTTTAYIRPTILTSNISNISSTTAIVGGNVTSNGGTTVTERGIYYSNDILSNGTKLQIGSGTGAFSTTLTGLTPNTTYYVKAYATNNVGTSYGSIITFKTGIDPQSPTLTTTAPANITSNSATLGGNVTSTGSSAVLERGVVLATGPNPTISNLKFASGNSGVGAFAINVTNLTANTTYYYRAYAINNEGTAYGNEVNFSTISAGVAPVAAFTANQTTIKEGESVLFTDQSTNNPTSWNWDFGDRNTSTLQNPSHKYSTSGKYTVKLKATNISGANTITKTDYIIVNTYTGILFNPDLTYGSITDIDGNVYKTIQIGTQEWMAENLRTQKYRNGDPIGTTNSSYVWAQDYPKYVWATMNDESLVPTYGRLYTWYAATDSRNICPNGWHLPTDDEWKTLITFLGGESVAGGKLKEVGTHNWLSTNDGATNSSGFTALPGGWRSPDNTFWAFRFGCLYWSSTLDTSYNAWFFNMNYNDSIIKRNSGNKSVFAGYSVRCVKDYP